MAPRDLAEIGAIMIVLTMLNALSVVRGQLELSLFLAVNVIGRFLGTRQPRATLNSAIRLFTVF